MAAIPTPVTKLLGCEHPVLLAGMGRASRPPLVAAVCNAGGCGVLAATRYTPAMLREAIADLKPRLRDPSLPFGIDVLFPQVGGNARKTNVDYTKGYLDELIDIVIESGAKLFVSAVGLPPRHAVDRLHKAGVLYMNMVGHPKHVHKACQNGADLICAQGYEAGGHTGDIATSILIPACADICKSYTSPITGQPVLLLGAGGISDGRTLAAALMLGASAVWVGTRFVAAKESSAPEQMKEGVIEADFDSTIRSTIWTGRPLRAVKTPFVANWEAHRAEEMRELQSKGIIVMEHQLDKLHSEGRLTEEIEDQTTLRPMGMVAARVKKRNQPAAEIVREMVEEAVDLMKGAGRLVGNGREARL